MWNIKGKKINNPGKVNYEQFLESKIKVAERRGITIHPDMLHPSLRPDQKDIVCWALELGAALVAPDAGMGKSREGIETMRILQERFGGKCLIVTELGAADTFVDPDPEVGEGVNLGLNLQYVTNQDEAMASTSNILVTNYERVRMGEFDFGGFTAVWLDEGNYVKNMASETTEAIKLQLSRVKWKYIATATPSPNEVLELVNYAHVLGICDRGQILTRFFQRNSTKAGDLTLHPQHADDFWLWVSSWCIAITHPSDLGYDLPGFELPKLNMHWVEVPINKAIDAGADRDGQGRMFIHSRSGLSEAAKIKRETIDVRTAKAMEILSTIFKDQLYDREGEKGGLHEGVSENLSTEEADGRGTCNSESEKKSAICGGSGTPRKIEEASERKQQAPSSDETKPPLEIDLRTNDEAIRFLGGNTGGPLCDMRDPSGNQDKGKDVCGPQPPDWRGEGDSLSSLQFWVRTLQGQYSELGECNRVPEQVLIWCHLNDEQKALERSLQEASVKTSSITGSYSVEQKHALFMKWVKKETTVFLSKPEIYGSGVNLQQSSKCIFVGINDSFNDIYQALKRIYRFYNPAAEVDVWLLYTPEEYEVVLNLQRKWKEHNEMRDIQRAIFKKYGLDQRTLIEERKRSFMVERKVYTGKSYTLINNDCVFEFKNLPDNSVDMILTSIPFGNHYEYTDKYNDFGHNVNNEDFFRQMDFLVPELLRVLKPGRIAAIHTKNRIHYGSVTGLGMSIMHRFTHAACDCFERNCFHTMGFHYIPTDVVAENNQTYRLTYGEMRKDSTKMGAGIPEEIWIFRKAPSSSDNAYADDPVTHNIEDYTLAHWQLDADSFWKSSGNRFLTPFELKSWGIDKLQGWWKRFNSETVYDFEEHVKLLQSLDNRKKLSRTFTTLPLRSNSEYIWNDINRMHGLNMEQSRRKERLHICPMPFDQVDRLIELYSNPGELIADPFAGLGTTGVRAVKKRRRTFLTELNAAYATCANVYLKETEYKNELPTLFDQLIDVV